MSASNERLHTLSCEDVKAALRSYPAKNEYDRVDIAILGRHIHGIALPLTLPNGQQINVKAVHEYPPTHGRSDAVDLVFIAEEYPEQFWRILSGKIKGVWDGASQTAPFSVREVWPEVTPTITYSLHPTPHTIQLRKHQNEGEAA